ncbi:hypothetical protein FRC00_010526 [Tulasnella sp. 408]|nr:hypothetical protein FRC00_010526 [Tulasnella sp. 408]
MSESSSTGPPADSLGETAARIRSLSTLLRWVSQPGVVITGTSLRRDQAVAQFLDSVALMFVSGRRRSDAAAVIPTFDPAEGYGLTVVAQGFNFARVTTPVGQADRREDDPRTMNSLLEMLTDDEVTFLVKQGHDTISLDLHVRHLESLINQTYTGKEKPAEADLNRLERQFKFLNLFVNLQSSGLAIPLRRCQQLPAVVEIPNTLSYLRLQFKKEDWLYELLMKLGSRPQLESGNEPNLVLTPESVYHIYQLVGTHLANIRRVLIEIEPLLPAVSQSRDTSEQRIKNVKASIGSMSNSLIIIDRLVSTSRSFWRAMSTLTPLFLEIMNAAPDIPPSPSPESTSATPPEDPHERRNGDHFDDKTEELEDDFALETTRPIHNIRQWFTLITQWTQIVTDLEIFLPRVSRDPRRSLRIRAGYADRAVDPHRQLSLFDTVRSILPDIPLGEKVTAIKQAISNKTLRSCSLDVLRSVSEDLDPVEWQEAFEGGIHCEAQLIQNYGKQQSAPQNVAVSAVVYFSQLTT